MFQTTNQKISTLWKSCSIRNRSSSHVLQIFLSANRNLWTAIWLQTRKMMLWCSHHIETQWNASLLFYPCFNVKTEHLTSNFPVLGPVMSNATPKLNVKNHYREMTKNSLYINKSFPAVLMMIHYSIFSGTLTTAIANYGRGWTTEAKWWGSRFIWAST